MSGNLYKKDHTPTTPGYAHGFNEPGLRNVGSYQVSGHPFITGSTNLDDGKVHMVKFPYVSKGFTVINVNTTAGEDLRVHFQSGSSLAATPITKPGDFDGTGGTTIAAADDVIIGLHFITVPAGFASVTFDVKCSKFYISNGSGTDDLAYQVMADLTNVSTARMYSLTGSGVTKTGNLGTEHEP
tara:strand:- start:487 stop:1038 length:552 start_codon:yes stop_codon:yes gene_type:complete